MREASPAAWFPPAHPKSASLYAQRRSLQTHPVIPHMERQKPILTFHKSSQFPTLSSLHPPEKSSCLGRMEGENTYLQKEAPKGSAPGTQTRRSQGCPASRRQPGPLSYQTRWHRDARLWLPISARCHMEDTRSCLGKERGGQELSDGEARMLEELPPGQTEISLGTRLEGGNCLLEFLKGSPRKDESWKPRQTLSSLKIQGLELLNIDSYSDQHYLG